MFRLAMLEAVTALTRGRIDAMLPQLVGES
jgi:hypothetical protein